MNLGLLTSVKGLQAAQRQIDVAGHNVANADTEGYTRQRVEQSSSAPIAISPLGHLGTGVDVVAVRRLRDQWIDSQLRTESGNLGGANVKQSVITQAEDLLGEPSDLGLAANLRRYWESWQSLSARPEDRSLRVNVRQTGVALAEQFNRLTVQFDQLRDETMGRVRQTIDDINGLAKRIAELNVQISYAVGASQNPNDLKDQQDRLITQLSEKVNVRVVESPSNGTQGVFIGGHPLVQGDASYDLSTDVSPAAGVLAIPFVASGQTAQVTGGALGALLSAYNETLSETDPQGVPAQLHALASGVIQSVNAVHAGGYGLTGVTGQNFFSGTNARDIAVNATITTLATGLDLIAAAGNDPGSLSGGPADNTNARAIAALRNARNMGGNTQTVEAFYQATVTQLGLDGQEVRRRVQTQGLLLESIKERQAQVSAVSTDEEMANVVRFQKAYAASARILNTVDEMLDIVVNLGR